MRSFIAAVALAATPALAQEQTATCMPRDDLVQALAIGYGEVSVGAGLMANGILIEVFVSQTGTFTIATSSPTGVSCMQASGDEWVFVDLPWPKQGELN